MIASSLRVRLLTTVAVVADGWQPGGLQDDRLKRRHRLGLLAAQCQRSDAEWRRETEVLGERYRANPRDADVAIRYAQALRATGQRAQAVAVLETGRDPQSE